MSEFHGDFCYKQSFYGDIRVFESYFLQGANIQLPIYRGHQTMQQCKCMVSLRVFPLIVQCLGWYTTITSAFTSQRAAVFSRSSDRRIGNNLARIGWRSLRDAKKDYMMYIFI